MLRKRLDRSDPCRLAVGVELADRDDLSSITAPRKRAPPCARSIFTAASPSITCFENPSGEFLSMCIVKVRAPEGSTSRTRWAYVGRSGGRRHVIIIRMSRVTLQPSPRRGCAMRSPVASSAMAACRWPSPTLPWRCSCSATNAVTETASGMAQTQTELRCQTFGSLGSKRATSQGKTSVRCASRRGIAGRNAAARARCSSGLNREASGPAREASRSARARLPAAG